MALYHELTVPRPISFYLNALETFRILNPQPRADKAAAEDLSQRVLVLVV